MAMQLNTVKLDPKKLRDKRGERKLKEVSELVGITPQMLCNYEAGTHDPSSSVLLRLCLLYGMNITDLKADEPKNLAA